MQMDSWLQEFGNWVTEEEEIAAYGQRFVSEFLPHLPQDIKEIILVKYWRYQYENALPFGLINAPREERTIVRRRRSKLLVNL